MKPATLFIFAPKIDDNISTTHACHGSYKVQENSFLSSFFLFHGSTASSWKTTTRKNLCARRRDHEEDHCSHRNIIIIKCSSKIVVGWILELEIQDLFRSGSSSSSSSPHLESERMNFFFFPPMYNIFFLHMLSKEGFLEFFQKNIYERLKKN